jgi:hypothetical protein
MFKESVRWKDFFRTQKIEHIRKGNERLGLPSLSDNSILVRDDDSVTLSHDDGLGTHLKPTTMGSNAPRASDTTELFLKRVEEKVLDIAFAYRRGCFECSRSKHIREVCDWFSSHPEIDVVPTDKTNSFRLIPIAKYIDQMQQHLSTNAKVIPHDCLTTVVDDASYLLNSLSHILSTTEKQYIEHFIQSRAIPTPKLLIKDHEKPKGGVYPTRLVIPASNFTSTFPKMGYFGIKGILESHGIQYTSSTIGHYKSVAEWMEGQQRGLHFWATFYCSSPLLGLVVY